jgi:serralysin
MPNVFYGTNDNDTVPFTDDFQFLYGFGGDDALSSTNDAVYCELYGGDGNDFLDLVDPGFGLADGGSGNDIIDGTNFFDELYGGSGNDSIFGGGIADFVDGGSGNDTIYANGIIFGGSGNDQISSLGGPNGIIFGGSGNDQIVGLGGDDRIDCGSGNDICSAGDGNDKLFGGKGTDNLEAGDGSDLLVGGRGRDFLSGGGVGNDDAIDVFRFTSVKDSLPGRAKRDQIDIFEDIDIIDLAKIDANTHKAGDQKFIFISDDAFSGKRGELRFDNTILSGDVDGDGKPDFQVQVIGADVLLGNLVL